METRDRSSRILVLVAAWCIGFLATQFYLDNRTPPVATHALEEPAGTPSTPVETPSNRTAEKPERRITDPEYYLENDTLRELLARLNRSPGPATVPLLEKPAGSDLTYSELLASVPSLEAALKKLRPVSSEAELVRLLCLIDSLVAGWSLVDTPYNDENRVIANLLVEHWKTYPQLITASNCVYCGNHFNLVKELATTRGTSEQWDARSVEIHPRYMQLVDTLSGLSPERRIHYARRHARLHMAGDPGVARYIAHILLDAGHYADFAHWAGAGLNGSQAVAAIKDLAGLPREYLLDIWEAGMRGGYVNNDLTLHLLATGHRPALRYVIWKLDGGAPYLQDYAYKHARNSFVAAIGRHTDLLHTSGPELSEYYAAHWRQIHWDSASGKWRI